MQFAPSGHPPLKSSISDIVDEKDREHIYNQSMGRHPPGQSFAPFMFSPGVSFHNQNPAHPSGMFGRAASPGSPEFTHLEPQMGATQANYATSGGKENNNPSDTFKKFMPRSEKKK